MLGDGVSQLASNLFRFGSKKRGVCICNAQCRLQSLGEGPLGPTIRTHHGSLDRLLQQTENAAIGGIVEGGDNGKGVLVGSAESVVVESEERVIEETTTQPPRLPPRTTSNKSAWRVKEEFDRGVEVEKFYHQINGDIFEITRRVRARNEDTIEQKCIKRKASVRLPPELPLRQPQPPRRQKSAEEMANNEQLEWFDRRAQQRHSARSAESGAVREETIEWLDRQRLPPRTASGPSEITVLKDEVPEWLLEHLPRKRTKPTAQTIAPSTQIEAGRNSATSYAKAFKEELAELLKKPLSRQSSGPGEFSLLKTDIVEWLTKLQSNKALPGVKTRRTQHRRNGSGDETPRSHSQEHGGPQDATRKRHSLGHSDQRNETEWVAFPLNRLQSLGKSTQSQTTTTLPQMQPVPNCCERRHHHERSRERKLRHSASEVVSNTQQPIYAKPHKERYQYVPKDMHLELLPPPVRESKRERSRRHQTQRSATVSDMSGQLSSSQKRKSSSAERAPRSPSPCTDPSCPLLPICTDPHCRFLECRSGSGNIVAKAQVHAVPPDQNDSQSPPPRSAPPIIMSGEPNTRKRLVICHDCRGCAPLLSCRNRKCLNATKCNSLPRCAADFNRLRTTLAQPPVTLKDIQPEYAALEDTSPYLPRRNAANGLYYRSNSQPNTLQRSVIAANGSSIGLDTTTGVKVNGVNGVNGNAHNKLLKSASAASLNSRRRRHKTVHFGENLLREVCQNRKLMKTEQVPSGSAPMKSNIQMLYNFVEGVLSAWVDDDEDQVRSGAESEPEHGALALKPIHRCNRLRYQCIKRIVEEAAQLQGTLKLGNSRYRHRHWRSTAKQCNEMFLRKVGI